MVSEEDNGFIIEHVERERQIIRICKIPNYQVGKYIKIKKKCGGAPNGTIEESPSGWNLALG